MSEPRFTAAENKARTLAFWTTVFNAHDLGLLEHFFASEFINHNALPGTSPGPPGARQVFTRLWNGCSDMRFDLETIVAEANTVVCIGTMTGTHDGQLNGIPATGRTFAATQVHTLTFNNAGLIAEHLAVRDDVELLRQLGMLPRHTPTALTNSQPTLAVMQAARVHRASASPR